MIGSKPIDGGHYIFRTAEQRNEFLAAEPAAEPFVRPYIGSWELINGLDRWILALHDATPDQLARLPLIRERIAKVRAFRQASRSAPTQKLADTPTLYHVNVVPAGPFLAIPETSSERREYIPIALLEPPTIPSNLLKVLSEATLADFALLTSTMHMAWTRLVGGRLESRYRYSIGVVYNLAHVGGWPIAAGGSDAVGRALAAHLEALGGSIRTGHPVETPADIPEARAVLFDTHPRALVAVYGRRALGRGDRRRIRRYRSGAASYKIDYALDGPIPWTARECRRAGTVHVGGTYEEIARAERSVADGVAPDRPFVLVGQQSLFDPSRAPEDKHTAWVYTHVPSASTEPVRERVEDQIERFAPGFRGLVLAARVTTPVDFESYNPNYPAGNTATGTHSIVRMLGRPGPVPPPLPDRYPGRLPVLGGHPARTGRPRDVRRQRRGGSHARVPGKLNCPVPQLRELPNTGTPLRRETQLEPTHHCHSPLKSDEPL